MIVNSHASFKIVKAIYEKVKTIRQLRIIRIHDLKIIPIILKYYVNKQNAELDMVIQIENIRYRLVDLESLFIVSPRYEKDVWHYLKPIENDVFIDVGAHIGKYTLRVAKLVGAGGKVIAIEPDPDNFKALLVGVKMNNLSNVIALNVAAYERECRLPLYVAPRSGRTLKGYLIGKARASSESIFL